MISWLNSKSSSVRSSNPVCHVSNLLMSPSLPPNFPFSSLSRRQRICETRSPMDSQGFTSILLCFLLILPHFSLSAAHFLRVLGYKKPFESGVRLKHGDRSAGVDPTRVTQISWQPRAFIYSGLLSDEECDHLINLARGNLQKSTVVDDETGESMDSDVRTSSGVFLVKAQDDIVAAIENRIAAWTFLPVENGESMQILRYEIGQKYEPHCDYFEDNVNIVQGGHRIATVLMYLSDVETGGETVFPKSKAKMTQLKDDSWSDCAKGGYAVKPKKGDAVLFFSLRPDAEPDTRSLHGSCPVIEGEKWSATKWIHVRSFDIKDNPADGNGGYCTDAHLNCALWASAGECQKNSAYMVGAAGHCRKSCNACNS